MAKLIAVLNVVAWSGFWAFGYLALTGSEGGEGLVPALMLAAAGAAAGLWAWLWLARHADAARRRPAPRPRAEALHKEAA